MVHLKVNDLTVRVCDDDSHGAYRFRCPTCDTIVLHDASTPVCALLTSVGVRSETWRRPQEICEFHDGGAFTCDDLLDFHFLLQTDDWLQRLEAAVRE